MGESGAGKTLTAEAILRLIRCPPGRIQGAVAYRGQDLLTLDESAARMLALGNDPVNAVHLNIPSVNAPVMPGRLTTTRKVTNVTGRVQAYRLSAQAPADTGIEVSPAVLVIAPNQIRTLTITIRSAAGAGSYRLSDCPSVPLPV